MSELTRESIKPTYDHRETGDRFTVEYRINNRRVNLEKIRDPFVSASLRLGWRDRLRWLFGPLVVTVMVSGDRAIVEDVGELDDDYKGARGSSRRTEFDEKLNDALKDFSRNGLREADAEPTKREE